MGEILLCCLKCCGTLKADWVCRITASCRYGRGSGTVYTGALVLLLAVNDRILEVNAMVMVLDMAMDMLLVRTELEQLSQS